MRGYAAIGLIGPKDPANIGGAMRAAHVFGASLVRITSPRASAKGFATDTTCAWKHIPVFHTQDPLKGLPEGCRTVAVEIDERARSLVSYRHPERALYLFGPESGSIPSDLIGACDDVVSVPSFFCLNLAAAVNVVLYDRVAKWRQCGAIKPLAGVTAHG